MASPDRAAELHAQLEASLRSLVTSDDWLRALDVASRFHDYSFANTQLIALQAHQRGFTPTRVAGYRKWQELGRQVRRDERGLQILAPIVRRLPAGEHAQPAVTDDEDERRVVGYRVVHVFDIAQTDGEPLPEVTPQLLTGDLPQQWDKLTGLITAAGFTLTSAEPQHLLGANGATSWTDRTVRLRDDLEGAQRFKTAAHELAHIRLHDPQGGERPDCRGVIEVEAESVAYIVATAVGIDTTTYSLPYVATWSDGNPATVAATAQRVIGCARSLLPELGLEHEPELALEPADTQRSVRRRLEGALIVEREALTQPHPDRTLSVDLARRRLLESALSRTFEHYREWLDRPQGEPARRHLEQRRISHEIIDRFQLGYASPAWTTITDRLRAEGFTDQDLLDAGISARARTGRLYDRMRGRLTFPLHDQAGRPVGLAGRLIEGDGPKYLNSPQTELYRKGELLYGLHLARAAIIEKGHAVIVEGYTDTLAAHQAGLPNTIAIAGTTLTEHHLTTLRRTTQHATLALDGDDPGDEAASRIAELVEASHHDLNIRIAELPAGLDPADLVAAGNAALLDGAVRSATPLRIHLIDRILDHTNLNEIEAKVRALRRIGAIVTAITDPHLRTNATDVVATRLGWEPSSSERDLKIYATSPKTLDARHRGGLEVDSGLS